MTACHANPASRNPIASLLSFLDMHAQASDPNDDFAEFERKVRSLFSAAEAAVVGEELARHDVDVPRVMIGGVLHRRVCRSENRYMTSAGAIVVERTLYRAGAERAVAAMDLGAGIVDGWWTPEAAKLSTWAMAHLPCSEAEELFQRVGRMGPSRSSLDRVVKSLSGVWEGRRIELERAVRLDDQPIDANAVSVAVCMDGVMLPMRDADRAGKRAAARAQGNVARGPAGYKEAACASLAFYDSDGERLGTRYLGRMPESGKVTLKAMLTDELADILIERPDLTVIGCADGAKDNWPFLKSLVPDDGHLCLDFYHAAAHLHDALVAAYGEGNEEPKFVELRRALRDDVSGADKVIRHLAYKLGRLPKSQKKRRKTLTRELKYMRKHRKHMDYANFRAAGLPIGSGVVEAANKTLVTVRMKRAGASWRTPGGQAVLTFRACSKSNRFDAAWEALGRSSHTPAVLVDNVVEFKRAA